MPLTVRGQWKTFGNDDPRNGWYGFVENDPSGVLPDGAEVRVHAIHDNDARQMVAIHHDSQLHTALEISDPVSNVRQFMYE